MIFSIYINVSYNENTLVTGFFKEILRVLTYAESMRDIILSVISKEYYVYKSSCYRVPTCYVILATTCYFVTF